MFHASSSKVAIRFEAILCTALLMFVCLLGCKRTPAPNPATDSDQPISNEPAASENTETERHPPLVFATNQPLFEELNSATTGIDFVQRLDETHRLAHLYHSGYSCGGVCLGDVNGDGLTDVFLASGPDANALFLNRGSLKFEKTNAFPAATNTWSVGVSMVDVDGDSDLDLFVCNYDAPNMLWINEGADASGNVQFSEVAKTANLDFIGPSHCPYFADFDNDGDLDLFLLTNRIYSPTGRPNTVASELGPDGKPRIKAEYAKYFRVVHPSVEVPAQTHNANTPGLFMLELGHEDRLYRNDGKGNDGSLQFHDVTDSSGLKDVIGHGLSALVWDANGDGLPDIYVANDYSDPDKLWINQGVDRNGAFRFSDGTDDHVPYTAWSAMGSDIADVNGDGRLDFMIADMAATTHFKAKSTMGEMTGWRRWVLENAWPRQTMRNMLYIDSGADRYKEAAFMAGVGNSDWTWSVKFADFDLDGRNDLYLTNGTARVFSDSDIKIKPQMFVGQTEWEIFRDKAQNRERNLAFRNTGDLRFDEVGATWNLDKEGMSYGAATGDLDNDGDLDLVVCNLDEAVSVYQNHAAESGLHWLRVKLEGDGGNRLGLGAVVTATLPNGDPLVRLMNPQTGFLSVNDSVLHFGLGHATSIKALQVHWPDGTIQELGTQDANQLITIGKHPTAKTRSAKTLAEQDFRELDSNRNGLKFRHQEKLFNDYQREFLLPGKLSQLGPGVAVADVNDDNLDDIFVGGAAGQSGELFIHQKDHSFRRVRQMPWQTDAACEDMGLLFFDADRDGDLDLYVAHGSNEFAAKDPRYADSLYLNQSKSGGPIEFIKCKPDALPSLYDSGSCVVGTDFDRDGDVDLFVGSRSIPAQYPSTPKSRLLRNDGVTAGEVQFTDVTEAVAPSLLESGLVTGAVWSDVDADGWTDLLVTNDWGPVRLYRNSQGTLEDLTKSLDLAQRPGWWNSIVGGDFDGDGDMDYATMNVGLNTKYGRASDKKPAILYRGDMDGNGQYDLVEAKSSLSGELPVRGRSCSCNAMPLLRTKFPTYKKFALSSLEGIYTDTGLENAERVAATEFCSGVWINESSPGHPQLHWQPLSVEAQVSPGFGAVAADFYGQHRPSLAMSQNHFTREPETGLWRGGLGAITAMTDEGVFADLETGKSGFIIAGDGKGLAVADLNADNRPDIVAMQNNAELKAFQLETKKIQSPIAVRLEGLPGNPLAFGARLQLLHGKNTLASTEVFGGSGYLSQSTSTVFFSRPQTEEDDFAIRVAWPSGKVTTTSLAPRLDFEQVVKIKEETVPIPAGQ